VSYAHKRLMEEYYAAREAQERRAEDYSYGYETETNEFYAFIEERITFKDFLINRKVDHNG
jgi:hypothetical protein